MPAAKTARQSSGKGRLAKVDLPDSAVTSQTPRWPLLKPLVPAENLEIEQILENQILVVRNLFTAALCKSLVAYFSTLPLTTTPGKPRRGEATRVNDRYQVDDPRFAHTLWQQTALHSLVTGFEPRDTWQGDVLGLNPNIRIYRYRPGQYFDQHYDESNKLLFGPDKISAKTTWTLLIYLSTCEGGETVFYPEPSAKNQKPPEPIVCALETGMALLHNHDDCMLHEGREVLQGEKWVLRSDIVVKR